MVSFNHYEGGAVGDWLPRRVVGIERVSSGYQRSFQVLQNGWKAPGGRYRVMVGGSSAFLPLSCIVNIQGDTPQDIRTPAWYYAPSSAPSKEAWEQLLGRAIVEKTAQKGSFAMESSVMEMKKHSIIMKIMYKGIEARVAKGFNGKKDYPNPKFRMMMASAADSSLSAMRINGGMRSYVLDGLLAMANGRVVAGLRLMGRRVK